MRRPSTVEVMLLSTIGLWALNLSVSRIILTNGFAPLAYATVRYGLAALVFAGLALLIERSLRIGARDLLLVLAAAFTVWLNQIAFVYALTSTTASVLGLILGATPIFAALLGFALRTERLSSRFWLGGAVSFAGVGLVALGSGSELSGDLGGILLGLATAATWAAYAVIVTPLMHRYSPIRVSALVLGLAWVGIALTGLRQSADQDYALGADIWLARRLRDAGAARRHERALVPLAAPDRPGAGDAGREPAAVRRRTARGRSPRRADRRTPARGRSAHRRRHPARAPAAGAPAASE